jgi:hypothetical protein
MSAYQAFSRQIWVALALATSACGGASLNQAKLAEAQAAVHAAETLGAVKDPQAKQNLQEARDAVTKAKRLSEDGDGDEANLYLQRAVVDADLASQRMRTRTEQEKATQATAKSMAMSSTLQLQPQPPPQAQPPQ